MIQPAPLIGPRYRLLDPLGVGGMGTVYRAYDRLTGHTVALKRVHIAPEQLYFASRSNATGEALLLALAQEFKILASLRHPNIISVLDYGFDAHRQPYFTMELLEQPQTLLEAGWNQPIETQINLLIQTLHALAYLHRRGILHHDLKPENVLVSQGQVRVLDFGLSVMRDQTREDDSSGTLLYLPPEIYEGKGYSPAGDLYALGVMAYEMLAGRHPFYTDGPFFIDQVLTTEPNFSLLDSHPGLASVLASLLAKQPEQRYQEAHAVIADLSLAIGQSAPKESAAIRESFLQAAAFVGRERELGQLTEALEKAQQGQGSAWLVGGESGAGKSRLLDELRTHALVAGFTVLRGQAAESGGLSYQLWRDPLRQLVLSTTEVTDLIASVLLPLVPDIGEMVERPVPLPAPLDEKAAQTRLFTTIAGLFHQQRQPILLLLEDIHWVEESLLPLPYLTRTIAEQSLLIVGSYRDDERPALPQELPEMHLLPLSRLSQEDVATLSVAMLGEAGSQPELLALLQQETEGNTFFLVEVVRALAEEAGQLAAIGRAELPERLMPQGIQTIITRRLQRIPPTAQSLLAQAAVLGRQLDIAVLETLAPELDVVNWWLPVCAEAAVLDVQDNRWQFSHDKLREGLLAQLAPAELQLYHAEVARVLERLYGADDQYAGQLAFHWGQAGRTDKEAEYSFRAGRYVRQQGGMPEAQRLLSRAFELTPADDRSRLLEIHLQRGAVWELLGAWVETETDYQAALALAQYPQEAAAAQFALGKLYRMRGEYETALGWLTQVQTVQTTLGNHTQMAQVLNEIGMVYYRQGEYSQAREHALTGLALAREMGDMRGIALALANLGRIAHDQGDYAGAKKLFEESLTIKRELGDKEGIADSLNNLGLIAYRQGDYAMARALHDESLTLRHEIGDKSGIADSLNSLANVALDLYDYATARALYEESLTMQRELGDKQGISVALNNLGSMMLDMGEYAAAQVLCEESLALRREMDDKWGIVSSLNNLGEVALGQGDYAAAWKRYTESLVLAAEIGDKLGVAYNQTGLIQLAMALGVIERAARLAAATEALLAAIDGVLDPLNRSRLDQIIATARTALGDAAFEFAWTAGQQMTLEEAVQYALSSPFPEG